jgi:hypothetical protein
MCSCCTEWTALCIYRYFCMFCLLLLLCCAFAVPFPSLYCLMRSVVRCIMNFTLRQHLCCIMRCASVLCVRCGGYVCCALCAPHVVLCSANAVCCVCCAQSVACYSILGLCCRLNVVTCICSALLSNVGWTIYVLLCVWSCQRLTCVLSLCALSCARAWIMLSLCYLLCCYTHCV